MFAYNNNHSYIVPESSTNINIVEEFSIVFMKIVWDMRVINNPKVNLNRHEKFIWVQAPRVR